MKRITTLTIVLAAMVLGLALPAAAATGLEMAPGSGPAGTEVSIHAVGFTPMSTFEVHGEGFDGPLLNAGTSNDRGEFTLAITIPSDAAAGEYTIAICETQFVACTDTESDFWVGTSATFTVEMVIAALPPAAVGAGLGTTPPGGGITLPGPPVTVAPTLPPTTTGVPLVDLMPSSGEPGSETIVAISGFTPDSDFEIHGHGYGLGWMGSGTTDAAGEASAVITIPGHAVRAFTVAVCEVSYVGCSDTESDFWVGAAAEFMVEHHIATDPMGDEPEAESIEEPDAAIADTVPSDGAGSEPTPISGSIEDRLNDHADVLVADEVATAAGEPEQDLVQTGGNSGDPDGVWWLLLVALATSLLGGVLGWRLRSQH